MQATEKMRMSTIELLEKNTSMTPAECRNVERVVGAI